MATAATRTSNAIYWLALSQTPGLGPARGRKLVQRFGNAQDIFHASLTELEGQGLQAHSAQSIALGKSLELAHEEFARATAAGVQVLTEGDPQWPTRLSEIYDPPLVLYVKGSVEAILKPGLAVVGTRHPTPYGIGMAERLACDLAARGLMIISGLARGVDAAAHRGALKAPGRTVAIFGTGVDEVYPKENKKLIEPILAAGGALVSEFPMATFPAPQNFPIRNRLISGLSLGVLVVEAAEHSGSRITARCALEQSRELFAVPSNVTSRNSWGPNTLIKQGAKLTATWEDVWEELPAAIQEQLESETGRAASEKRPGDEVPAPELKFTSTEKKVLSFLKEHESTHIDQIVEKFESQLSSAEIFTALFELELSGRIRQMAGKNYVKAF